MQNVAECGEGGDPSSSEDGCTLASLDGAGSQGEGGSANGGRAWDTSGVPVDYTFKVTPASTRHRVYVLTCTASVLLHAGCCILPSNQGHTILEHPNAPRHWVDCHYGQEATRLIAVKSTE